MGKAGVLGTEVLGKERIIMTLTLGILFLLLLFLMALSALFSGTETAFFSLSTFQISKMEEEKVANAGIVRNLMRRSDQLLNGILFGNLIVNVLLTATATLLSYLLLAGRGFNETLVFLMDILGVTFLLLILGEVTPKAYAIQNAERIIPRLAPLIRSWMFIWSPILRIITLFSNFFAGLFHAEGPSGAHTPEELKALLDISAEGGELELEARDMISSVFDFGETRVKEIMVPRIDIVGVDIETDIRELLRLVRETEYSRIPVYRENIDRIVGIVYAKDLLKHIFLDGENREDIEALLKPAYFVPESKRINNLLKELQRERVHMAIVVDEYGGTAGLVTMEDILEEIVGEIHDEYDAEEQMFKKLDDNAYLVDGRLDIDDLSDLIGSEIEVEGVETVGGVIYQALGRIPHQGEVVVHGNVRFIVSKVIGKRVAKVKVIRVEGEAQQQEGAE